MLIYSDHFSINFIRSFLMAIDFITIVDRWLFFSEITNFRLVGTTDNLAYFVTNPEFCEFRLFKI
jgi:hypothetical protein